MTTKKISQISATESTALSDTDLFEGEEGGGTSFQVAWSVIKATLDDRYAQSLRGYMTNGKLSVTVASSNLTVAVKTLADGDPSSSDPVRVRIGDTEHTLTAALSVTANAATNWCNSGGSELATNAVGYFVYLGYNATDGVVIGFARIPYGLAYSDFSATSTNNKFCKINDISNATATDEYENVGYFEATLSAGAGYTWSSPTNVISKPTHETNRLTYTPTLTGFSGTPTVAAASYQVIGKRCRVEIDNADGTSNATGFTISAPFANNSTTTAQTSSGLLEDNGSNLTGAGRIAMAASASTIQLLTNMASGTWTAANAKSAYFHIEYFITT